MTSSLLKLKMSSIRGYVASLQCITQCAQWFKSNVAKQICQLRMISKTQTMSVLPLAGRNVNILFKTSMEPTYLAEKQHKYT